jgi:hypothetical protein
MTDCDGSGYITRPASAYEREHGETHRSDPCPGCRKCRPCKRCEGWRRELKQYGRMPCVRCKGTGVEPA